MNGDLFKTILQHYVGVWGCEPQIHQWDKGPIDKLRTEFRVLEFSLKTNNPTWVYASCGMSSLNDPKPIELHIYSSKRDENLIELLYATAYHHKNSSNLGLNHTVNFGRGWQDNSYCEHGFISLPYLNGPNLEILEVNNKTINFYWLIPVTRREVDYAISNGIEALESLFDTGINYIDSSRKSFV